MIEEGEYFVNTTWFELEILTNDSHRPWKEAGHFDTLEKAVEALRWDESMQPTPREYRIFKIVTLRKKTRVTLCKQ